MTKEHRSCQSIEVRGLQLAKDTGLKGPHTVFDIAATLRATNNNLSSLYIVSMSIMLQSRLVQSRAEVCVARPSAMRPSRRAALTTVSAQRSVYERQSLAQTAFAAGAALLLSVRPLRSRIFLLAGACV